MNKFILGSFLVLSLALGFTARADEPKFAVDCSTDPSRGATWIVNNINNPSDFAYTWSYTNGQSGSNVAPALTYTTFETKGDASGQWVMSFTFWNGTEFETYTVNFRKFCGV